MGRRRAYTMAFEGLVPSLERRYRDTDSSQQRERIEEYMSFRPCPVCHGARLKPEVLAVTVGELNIHEFTRMSVTRALGFLEALELSETDQLIGSRVIKEIKERLTFLDKRRGRLPRPRSHRGDASPAARRSAYVWRRRSAASSSACSTSSTSRPSGSTSATTAS
jgi:hypothetical protein